GGGNTTSTAAPMATEAGSTELIGASAPATRLPTRRIDGSSSSVTTTTLYGARSAYAGSSGGWGMTKDQIVARPDIRSQRDSNDWHHGQTGRGGWRRLPHEAQAWMRSSLWAAAAKNGAMSASSVPGNKGGGGEDGDD